MTAPSVYELLARARLAGGEVRLSGAGDLTFVSVPREIAGELRSRREEVVAVLTAAPTPAVLAVLVRAEALGWPRTKLTGAERMGVPSGEASWRGFALVARPWDLDAAHRALDEIERGRR